MGMHTHTHMYIYFKKKPTRTGIRTETQPRVRVGVGQPGGTAGMCRVRSRAGKGLAIPAPRAVRDSARCSRAAQPRRRRPGRALSPGAVGTTLGGRKGGQEGDAHGSPRAGGFNPLRESSYFLSPLCLQGFYFAGCSLLSILQELRCRRRKRRGKRRDPDALSGMPPGVWGSGRPGTRVVWGHPSPSGLGNPWRGGGQGRREQRPGAQTFLIPPSFSQLQAFYGREREASHRDLPLHSRSPNLRTAQAHSERFYTLGKSHFVSFSMRGP